MKGPMPRCLNTVQPTFAELQQTIYWAAVPACGHWDGHSQDETLVCSADAGLV